MNILIIEDEYLLADELEEILLSIDPSHKVIAKLSSIEEAVTWISSHSCDLIFMDIQLSDGLSFAIFDRVEVKSPVIFTTAYDQYTIEAFNVNGISYILKPIEKTDVIQALDKYELLKQSYLKNKEQFTTPQSKYKEEMILTLGPINKKVHTESILYFQADDRYVFALLNTGERMFTNHTLRDLETLLNPHRFFRINRTYIVNRHAIKEWRSYSKGRVEIILDSEKELPSDLIVSRGRTSKFNTWIKQ